MFLNIYKQYDSSTIVPLINRIIYSDTCNKKYFYYLFGVTINCELRFPFTARRVRIQINLTNFKGLYKQFYCQENIKCLGISPRLYT